MADEVDVGQMFVQFFDAVLAAYLTSECRA
jgi:hypothetical protein